jgi:hypothetical protein
MTRSQGMLNKPNTKKILSIKETENMIGKTKNHNFKIA